MSRVIDLSTLVAGQGFAIQGDAAGDRTGFAVSGGDVNGDGIGDLIVGAYKSDAGGTDAGAAYVVYGVAGATRTLVDLTDLPASAGFAIRGAQVQDLAGKAVSFAGDVNGDGIGDIIVGAPQGDQGGAGSGGDSYVIFGAAGTARGMVALSDMAATDGFRISGTFGGSESGQAVSNAGDVNGDGIDDLIVTGIIEDNPGAIRSDAIIYGKAGATRDTILLNALDGGDGFKIVGARADGIGVSGVSAAGDVNGDGFDDLIVGAYVNELNQQSPGAAYVIFGKEDGQGTRGTISVGTLSTYDGYRILGAANGAKTGLSVSDAGDVNGDGYGDLIIGATNDGFEGSAYVVYGKPGAVGANLNLASLTAADGFKITGEEVYDRVGLSVSAAGDINGDGFDDVLVSGVYAGAANEGRVYVIYGRADDARGTVDLASLADADGFVIEGATAGDAAGRGVGRAGDANGDGIDDLILGAPRNDAGGTDAGAAYVIYGMRPGTAVTRNGSDIDQRIFGGNFNDTINGLGGNDTIDGGKGADRLDGGEGFNILRYAGSAAAVTVNLATGAAAGGDAAGDVVLRFSGIIGSRFNDVLTGRADGASAYLEGGAGNDTLTGGTDDDRLLGGLGNDSLIGGDGADRVVGGTGKDALTGGLGGDYFEFTSLKEMSASAAKTDVILDFKVSQQDHIDLTAIDASTVLDGHNAFVFNGTRAIGTSDEGEISYRKFDLAGKANDYTLVSIDTDGDAQAEAVLRLKGLVTLSASEFIL